MQRTAIKLPRVRTPAYGRPLPGIVRTTGSLIMLCLFLTRDTAPPPPQPSTDQARIALGARLFAAPLLSGNGTQSCMSCHQPERAFTDGRPTAIGSTGEVHPLNTPSVIGVVNLPALGWARPDLVQLKQQIPIPLFSDHPIEMGAAGHEVAILRRLASDTTYSVQFRAAYPTDPAPISWPHIIDALAAYLRSLQHDSPYDRFLAGDPSALSEAARRGRRLFVELGCASCHAGPLLTNGSYHNIGLYGVRYWTSAPPGHAGLADVTGDMKDRGRWRVPSLRNVTRTAPYFHDGSAATLDDVLDVYAQGGRGAGQRSPLKSAAITPITLRDKDRADLLAFFAALTDDATCQASSQHLHEAKFVNK